MSDNLQDGDPLRWLGAPLIIKPYFLQEWCFVFLLHWLMLLTGEEQDRYDIFDNAAVITCDDDYAASSDN